MKKPSLYIGTTAEKKEGVEFVPMIKTVAKDFDSFSIRHQFSDMKDYTHMIFTSKNAVKIFFEALKYFRIDKSFLRDKIFFCIGGITLKTLLDQVQVQTVLADLPTQEGLIETLDFYDLKQAYIFYPRSSRARPSLCQRLMLRQVRVQVCDLYDTHTTVPKNLPDLYSFDEIIFSSPSTVDAFMEIYPNIPKHLKMSAIGPITRQYLKQQATI